MILDFRLCYNRYVRENGERLFYHWNKNFEPKSEPSDDEIKKLLGDKYALDFDIVSGYPLGITIQGRPYAECYLILNSYDTSPSGNKTFAENWNYFNIVNWDNGWYHHKGDDWR